MRGWEARWQQSAGCTTYTFFPSILTRKRVNWLTPDRWMTRLITGHDNFGTYFKRMRIREDD